MGHEDNIPIKEALSKSLTAAVLSGKRNTSREKMVAPGVSVLVTNKAADAYYRSYLTPSRTTFPFSEEGLTDALSGRVSKRIHTKPRPPVPVGEREKTLAKTTSPKYKTSDAVVRSVLERSGGRSEYSGEPVGWFKKNGEPGLTVHHPWADLDGTGVAIAITFSEHARVHYGADGRELNEALKARLREIEPGEQPDEEIEEQAA